LCTPGAPVTFAERAESGPLVVRQLSQEVDLPFLIDDRIAERVKRIEIPFNEFGVDPYGISQNYLARSYTMLSFFYRRYFSVRTVGVDHVPARGRAMLVGNHSGGVAIDGAMVIASMFFDMDPPRLAQGMAEKFINRVPFMSLWSNRTGHFTGLPEHASRLLEDDRLLMVFPEGARGTAKLYKERHSLVNFGTGFVRLALKTRTPIIPFGFVGGGEAVPTIFNAYALGKAIGAPYIPVTPYLFAVPLPVRLEVTYGEPIVLSGTGTEDDEVIHRYVDRVKTKIAELIEVGRERRRGALAPAAEPGARPQAAPYAGGPT
jgi:1-acyl-sn-glycerol-3-phosphate acyltransferase